MFGFLKSKYFWIVLLIIIVSLTAVEKTSLARPDITIVEKMVQGLYAPLQRGVNSFRDQLNVFSNYFSNKQRLVESINRLEKEQQRYRLENQTLREYRYEVERLTDLLDFKEQNLANMNLIPAQVIARSPNNWYSNITINRGYNHGIDKGMAVITPLGLVGRVTTVGNDTAVVILVTDREGAVGALVQETRVPGIVVGSAKGKYLIMNHLPFYSEVKPGNRVVTSRFSEYYPPGIMIGKIGQVKKEPENLIKTAIINPSVDLDQIEEVLVISDYTNPAPQWDGVPEQPNNEEPQQ